MSLRSVKLSTYLGLILGMASPVFAVDEVALIPNSTFKVPGGRIRGQIQSESPTIVKIQAPTGLQEVPVDQIDSISYEGQPSSFLVAQTKEAGGDLAAAADQYKRAANDAAGKPLLVQAAQFGQAHAMAEIALASPSKANDAITQLEAFLKAHGKSRHQGPALEDLTKLYLQKGETDKADKVLDELEQIAWAADRAAVMKTRVLAKKGQYDDAIKTLDKIITAAPKGSARAVEARLAKAESLAGLKKFDEAEATVKEVIKETPPEKVDIQGLAWNTLGDCLRAAGQPKAALLAYLHTDILYDKDKEQHSRALYNAAQLFRELKRDDRADEKMDELKQKYPQSPWLTAKGAK
jgi:tetratricopeptide (TPR) repeat protein